MFHGCFQQRADGKLSHGSKVYHTLWEFNFYVLQEIKLIVTNFRQKHRKMCKSTEKEM